MSFLTLYRLYWGGSNIHQRFRLKWLTFIIAFTLKNAICVSKSEDMYLYDCQICTLVESDYAKRYREKHRAQCKAWNERKKAKRLASGQPTPKKKKVFRQPKFTEEERKERNRQSSLEYYRAHRDEYNRKRRERYQRHKEQMSMD